VRLKSIEYYFPSLRLMKSTTSLPISDLSRPTVRSKRKNNAKSMISLRLYFQERSPYSQGRKNLKESLIGFVNALRFDCGRHYAIHVARVTLP